MLPGLPTPRKARLGLTVLLALCLAVPLVPATTAQNPVYGVDGRVFPEPMQATSFLHFEDFIGGIELLHEAHPGFMDVRIIGESVQGRPIYFVELTNEASDKSRDEKLQIGYSASIHANEAAGREGMVRVIEDLVTGTGPLGDLRPMLDDLILNVWFPNPDSWASGDHFSSGEIQTVHECDRGFIPLFGGPAVGYCPTGYDRENALGVDLNREFPNPGWILESHTPMSEPESRSVVKELRYSGRHANLVAGTDLHGMVDSPNMMRAIIPNQDMDFHRMSVTMRFLKDLEDRVNNSPRFAEWHTIAEALCMVPETDPQEETLDDTLDGVGAARHDHTHTAFEELPADMQAAIRAADDGDAVWTLDEARTAAAAAGCQRDAYVPQWGEAGHGEPFLWGARWDQIGYTDSGFTSDYLMISPRSPTGGMGAIGTITEFAYSHIVPDNKYVAKLNDMHVAGVRETVRAQMEYTLLTEWPRLTETGKVLYAESQTRVTSDDDPNPYQAEHGKAFDLADESTWFDFDQVPYDVANTDFWAELGKYMDDGIEAMAGADITTDVLAGYDTLVVTDHTIDDMDVTAVKAWVEAGGNLILTDRALQFFDAAGLTQGAVYNDTHYLGHSDLTDMTHPLLQGVDWNARATTEGPPIGYAISQDTPDGKRGINEYPQWHLKADALGTLDVQVAGTTHGDPSLGTATLGDGNVHFIGAALAQPVQHNDHRYGLAPYAVSALTYQVFVNALGGAVQWQEKGEPFVPHYPADPLYGATDTDAADDVREDTPAPGYTLLVPLGILAVALVGLRRRR